MAEPIGAVRPRLMREYVENQITHLQTIFPTSDRKTLEEFVKSTVQQQMARPRAKIIEHPSYGNSRLATVDLLDYIYQNNNKVLTPSGTVYETSDVHTAFDKEMVDSMLKARSTIKKEMLDARAKGRNDLAELKNYQQGLIKINTNSIIGAHGSEHNAMYDKENFGAITSLSRHSIMLAYTFTERFLEANFFFLNIEHVYNFLVTTRRHCPDRETINRVLTKFRLFQPYPDDVLEFIVTNMAKYTIQIPRRELQQYLEHIPLHELAFIYYNRNLKHILQYNAEVFRPWIMDFMSAANVDWNESVEPTDLYKQDGDLIQIVATVYNKMLDGQPIYETPKHNPALAISLTQIAKHMQRKLDSMQELFDTFLYSSTFIGQVEEQKEMIRHTVIISDTDSVIFTTKNWITWFLGGTFRFQPETYQVHSLVVYLLTKSIATLVQTMSKHRGAIGANIKRMNIKNEYLYPVLMRCMQRKHYAGRITIQEGRILPKPKLDIKGVNFRSSVLPKITLDFVQNFIINILDEMEQHTTLYVGEYISKALNYERTILTSLQKGELTYCGTTTIKFKEEYAKPESSVYANYLMWEEVFAPKYGTIHIPNKVPLISMISNGMRMARYQEWLQGKDYDLYTRLMQFLAKMPLNRKISRIPIAATLTTIPEELIPLVDMRGIAYRNMAPIQLAMKGLNVDLGNGKNRKLLFVDNYSTSQENPLQ